MDLTLPINARPQTKAPATTADHRLKPMVAWAARLFEATLLASLNDGALWHDETNNNNLGYVTTGGLGQAAMAGNL